MRLLFAPIYEKVMSALVLSRKVTKNTQHERTFHSALFIS